jgi:uncharacterized protein
MGTQTGVGGEGRERGGVGTPVRPLLRMLVVLVGAVALGGLAFPPGARQLEAAEGWTGGLPTDSPVADAAMRGDVEAVRSLIRTDAQGVNTPQGDGMTALHWAAVRGNGALAELLLEAGADVAAETRIGAYTPLHLAAREGAADVVRALLEAGAEAGATTRSGEASPLHLAAGAGSAEAVALLLDRGLDPDLREGEWGQTPLIFAASAGRTEVVQLLLRRGADPSLVTQVRNVEQMATVQTRAAARWQEVLTEFRETEGAAERTWQPSPSQLETAALEARKVLEDPAALAADEEREDEPQGSFNQNHLVGSWGGLTPLLHAVREGHMETVVALLEGGADINQVSAGDGTSPLLMAAVNGQFDVAIRLVEEGADPGMASVSGNTPLYAVLERQWANRSRYPQVREHEYQEASHLDLMTALLEAGADPNVRLEQHLWYMSHISCGNFNCGLEVTWGATPFWRAAYGLDVEAMRLLALHGADPNIPTRRPRAPARRPGEEEEPDPSGLPPVPTGGPGVFPIHAASGVGYGTGFGGNAHRYAATGFMPAVRFLVEELGIDVNLRDYNGHTALHHAASRGDDEMVLYLVEHGADVTVVSREGQTTADMANGPVQRVSPYPSTVKLLESLGSKNSNRCLSC